jgi:hypothetical protein
MLWAGAPASAGAASHATTTVPKSPCRPGTPATAPVTASYYDAARTWLGPDPLPSTPPVGPLLAGYRRFGAMTETQFVSKYRSADDWIFPPHDGFLTVGGKPVRAARSLSPGGRIDRFSYPGGGYLAPASTPFAKRALPPQYLNTPAGTPQSNYHLYCVLKAFTVDSGPIAPWFEQPGLGLQYKLESRYLPEAGTELSVTWLLQNKFLVEELPLASRLG